MSFQGADPDALDTAAIRLERVARYADAVLARLRRQQSGLVYTGPAAEMYRSTLSTVSITAVENTAAGLRERAGHLKAQATQQRRASAGRKGGAGKSKSAATPKPPPPPPWQGKPAGTAGTFRGPLPGENPRTAPKTLRRYVVYEKEIRVDGTVAWRNHNPGNLKGGGEMSKSLGAIGHDATFAIFPNQATGDAAQRALILQRWPNQSIEEMLSGVDSKTGKRLPFAYAPKSDSNDPVKYAASVAEWTGLDVKTMPINCLRPAELDALLEAMQRYENATPGKVVPRQ